jgi:DNA-binding Lrp family transcriptional regulator
MNQIQLTDLDLRLVAELAKDCRIGYRELGERLGIPASTCHGRVRALEEAGVIRGYHADIDPEAAGLGVHALIQVRVHSHRRDRITEIFGELRELPGVQQVYIIGGDRDFMLHVACASVPALRDFVSTQLSSRPELAQTQTQLVFEHATGLAPA